jgi:2-hydroxy-6-oxonona-2,4-dienedioate hydrolase
MNEALYRHAEKILWSRVGCSPSERRVRLRRIGTEVRLQEVGEGEPVLFIHGGPNSGSTWAPLVARMGGFRCLLVDRPGTGLSPAHAVTAENLPEIGAAFLADVLDGMGIERAHVVASSFGGHIALRSAAATRERFLAMVQMSCPALAPGERPPPFQHLFRFRAVRRVLNALPPNPRANRMIMRQLGHGASLTAGRIPESFFDWYLELQRHTATNRNDGEMIASVLGARPRLTLGVNLLAAARVPTLFLWGEDDTFGGLDVARRLVEAMPDARLEVMPGAGHLPWLDDADHAARVASRFLAGESVAAAVA